MRDALDAINWWVALVGIIALSWIFFELGFQEGQRRRFADQDEKSYTSTIVASLLGLLGLLLAFSFSIVEERFQARKALIVQDANAIRTAYLRAGTIAEPHGRVVKNLLREYVSARLTVTRDNYKQRLQQFEKLQIALWTHANAVAVEHPNSEIAALFLDSINHLINLHEQRIVTIVHYRLPVAIFGAVFVVSLLAVAGLGHSSGMTRTRSIGPTFVLILSIAVFETLIVDLDRPLSKFSQISQDAMIDVKETLSRW